jgi:hypothetical protein
VLNTNTKEDYDAHAMFLIQKYGSKYHERNNENGASFATYYVLMYSRQIWLRDKVLCKGIYSVLTIYNSIRDSVLVI